MGDWEFVRGITQCSGRDRHMGKNQSMCICSQMKETHGRNIPSIVVVVKS